MLELLSINKKLGTFSLSDLNLTVQEGQYFVLLGPSGGGKTVLLEIISGLLRPDSGRVMLSGQDITHCPPEHRGIAMVMQDYALFPHLTVFQNLVFGLPSHVKKSKEKLPYITSISRLLEIETILHRDVRSLSGGEQQRVALGRALATKPSLLLLDEPLSAVDTSTRTRLRGELKRIQRQANITFLHVTHDADEAYVLADQIGLLLERRILIAGSPYDILRYPSYVEVTKFLHLKNVFPVEPQTNGAFHIGPIMVQGPIASNEQRYAWIRPDDIRIGAPSPDLDYPNYFSGTLVEWKANRFFVELSVDVHGIVFSALLGFREFDKLNTKLRQPLTLYFDQEAVHRLSFKYE